MQTADAVEKALRDFGFQDVTLVDRNFSLVDQPYIEGLGRRYLQELESAGLKFSEGDFDCDDFTIVVVGNSRIEHGMIAKKRPQSRGKGLALGMAKVMLDVQPHLAVVAVLLEEDQLVVRLYEPQPVVPDGSMLPAFPLCLNEIPASACSAFLWCYM
jgi:hypothetical protein